MEKYLKLLLTEIMPYEPTVEDSKSYLRNKVDYIFDKLNRKKFRRKKMGQESLNNLIIKIQESIKKDSPIQLVIPFGGYKHFWSASHPEPDWAELFQFRYITEYVQPIAALYKHGVTIEYVSEDLIVPRMDNYPDKAIEIYMKKFSEVLTWYQKQLSSNIHFTVSRVSSMCDKETLINEVLSKIPEKRKAFELMSDTEKEKELKRSHRSVFWKGKLDLSHLTEQEKLEKTIESRLIELTFYETESQPEYIGNYYGDNNRICVVFSFGLSHDNAFDDLTLGSAHGSIAEFWIGRGVIEDPNNPHPRIITAKQYEQLKEHIQTIPVDLSLEGKNYSKIEVVPLIN